MTSPPSRLRRALLAAGSGLLALSLTQVAPATATPATPPVVAHPATQASPATQATLNPPTREPKSFGQGKVVIVGAPEFRAVLNADIRLAKKSPKPEQTTYQWFRDAKPIGNATNKTYRVRPNDVGTRLTVQATLHRRDFDPKTFTSKKSKRILKASPRIDQRCLEGSVLCADVTDRKLRWVENGEVRLVLDARFARPGMINRLGTFSVTSKVKDGYSPKYRQAMPFTLCYSNPYCIHYSAEFAAVAYAAPHGSHGCINIRDLGWLEWLYNRVSIGTKVVVYE